MKKFIALIMFAVLMIGFAVVANAAVGTVVYATKVDEAPNMEEDTAFIDESWGEPAIVLNSSSANTELFRYWTEENNQKDKSDWDDNKGVLSQILPEDNDVELYYLWDSKYIYFGMKTLDANPSGAVQTWRGDGFQFWLCPLASITQNYIQSYAPNDALNQYVVANESIYGYWATLDTSDWDAHSGGAAQSCDFDVFVADDGYLYAYVRIPLMKIGLNPKSNLHGVELATSLLRTSSTGVEDYGYAGWLAWGKFFYETKCEGLNTVVLVDPAQGSVDVAPETDAPETDAPETEAPETDAPETEAPETEAPETEAPETEAPETEAPETDAPETDAPVVETDAPETEAPETDAPETEAPETDAPETEAPETDAPETEAPETEAPETDAPETDAPVVETDAPETDAPVVETDAPATDAPATPAEPVAEKNNTGLIIGIACAVVVVGAVVGIVLGKKKK